jgi:hypothetical protein
MDPRLDTGGWLTLTKMHCCTFSRQGLSPCKIHRAYPGAITIQMGIINLPDPSGGRNDL